MVTVPEQTLTASNAVHMAYGLDELACNPVARMVPPQVRRDFEPLRRMCEGKTSDGRIGDAEDVLELLWLLVTTILCRSSA